MHAIALSSFRTAARPTRLRHTVCRVVAGSRTPTLHSHNRQRDFTNSSSRSAVDPSSSASSGVPGAKESGESGAEVKEDEGKEGHAESVTAESEVLENDAKKTGKSGRPVGGGRMRAGKQREKTGMPVLELSDEYWDRCVLCLEEERKGGLAPRVKSETSETENKAMEEEDAAAIHETHKSIVVDDTQPAYDIYPSTYNEIRNEILTKLTLPPPKSPEVQSIIRPTPLITCPHSGSDDLLRCTVESIATALRADLIRLDVNDLAEILAGYSGENIAWQKRKEAPISHLVYDSALVGGKTNDPNQENESPLTSEEAENARDSPEPESSSMEKMLPGSNILAGFIGDWKSPNRKSAGESISLNTLFNLPTTKSSSSEPDQWSSLKLNAALERIILSAEEKAGTLTSDASDNAEKTRRLIIQLHDYADISGTETGQDLITRMRTIVDKKWKEGKEIALIGTSASGGILDPSVQMAQDLLHARLKGTTTQFYLPFANVQEVSTSLEKRAGERFVETNLRLIEHMAFAMLSGSKTKLSFTIRKDLESLAPANDEIADAIIHTISERDPGKDDPDMLMRELTSLGLHKRIFSKRQVQRLVTVMVGQSIHSNWRRIGGLEFCEAIKQSRQVHEKNLNYFTKYYNSDAVTKLDGSNSHGSVRDIHKKKLNKILSTCSGHETKLSKGVVLSTDIKTTFDDIRAPADVIEALKTLTGLSFLRPEAFSYGVLATDKIPGLLLYGPPGTGKTLLAKAVAKESGATVLEVSGADLNDMYVGEGEKNVKALFSLAKKLSPCIVFIDEADAIFAARGNTGKRSSHREMINQFLREWDGMKDMGTFIMIATNRPFDLDDAVLRRLPRRLLVDLPLENDREAILKIHLKDEQLAEDVSITEVAKDTPLYSGSDLKNICVAAALACIRDENTEAAKWTGEGAYVYPTKRTLTKAHFKKALDEISASISEDMSTLSQIRKFDERYGDRKGRRKKKSSMGFGVNSEVEKEGEAGRVRTVQL